MILNDKPAIVYWLDKSLYLNITNKCSNNCWFCFRNYKKGVSNFNLKLAMEPQLEEVIFELEKTLSTRHWNELVFCGFGEPTERLDILLEVSKWIKKRYPTIPIRLDTNGHGYALNKRIDVAEELKTAGVSKVSISLNGHNQETYNENCKPTFSEAFNNVLMFIKKAKLAGLNVEVSAIRMTEVDLAKVELVAKGLDVPFKVRDYIPCFW